MCLDEDSGNSVRKQKENLSPQKQTRLQNVLDNSIRTHHPKIMSEGEFGYLNV